MSDPTRPHPVLELRDVAVELGGRPVLRGIDLALEPGAVLAVLGANGSGKSTLVRTALGLAATCRGEVRLFGTPLHDFDAWHRVGFVPQRVVAAGGIPASVREVVASGRLSRRRLLRPAGRDDRRAVAAALEQVGLADRARDAFATLSGGQQQRVLVARALVSGPELMFLDEPTAGIDLPSQDQLAVTLQELVARGTTLVLVLHELGALTPLIGRTVVMSGGRVAYDGPPLVSFTEAEGHDHVHHPDAEPHPVFAPGVAAPLERPEPREPRA